MEGVGLRWPVVGVYILCLISYQYSSLLFWYDHMNHPLKLWVKINSPFPYVVYVSHFVTVIYKLTRGAFKPWLQKFCVDDMILYGQKLKQWLLELLISGFEWLKISLQMEKELHQLHILQRSDFQII